MEFGRFESPHKLPKYLIGHAWIDKSTGSAWAIRKRNSKKHPEINAKVGAYLAMPFVSGSCFEISNNYGNLCRHSESTVQSGTLGCSCNNSHIPTNHASPGCLADPVSIFWTTPSAYRYTNLSPEQILQSSLQATSLLLFHSYKPTKIHPISCLHLQRRTFPY